MHTTIKRVALILAASSLLLVYPTEVKAETKSDFAKYHGVLPDAYYDGLSVCETNGNWQHSTLRYTGGLGIYRGTWQRWSDSQSAKNKTPAAQVKVADAIAFYGHINPDGSKVSKVGPWGWGCLKMRRSLQAFICKSKKQIVQRWKRNC